jgi:acetyl esterase/lipase
MIPRLRQVRFAKRALLLFTIAVPVSSASLGAQQLTFTQLAALPAPPPDHRIPYGDDPLQFGNLRLPKGPGPHPVVLFIHGGCWLSQYDITHAAPFEQALADSGFAVWSIEYRRVGNDGGGWPGTFTDIARAADFLRELAPRYALDLNRVIASGHSAGGEFALWLAARRKIPPASPLFVADPLVVHGVLGLAPAPDLEGLHTSGVCGNVINRLMGGSPAEYPDRYAAASPMKLVPIPVPQVLVIGAHDRTWAPIGRLYLTRARAVGDSATLAVDAPDSGHFDMLAPTTTTWPLIIGALKQLRERLRR